MISAILLCGGSGTRFNDEKNKVLFEIDNKPIYQYSVDILLRKCNEVIIVCKEEEKEFFKYKNCKLVTGGKERHLSVLNGLNNVKFDKVLIHDGARPFLDEKDLEAIITKLDKPSFLAIKPKNTIRTLDFNTLDRNNLIEALTPQGGSTKLFIDAINKCIKDNFTPTDDIQAIERFGIRDINIIYSSEKNIKITTKEDIV